MSREAAAFPPEGFQKLLEAEALRASLPLYEPALHALAHYLAELDSWRQRINLTGDLDPEDLCVHAVESAAGASLLAHGARVLDIGSGGGFPGVPISIARPDLSVTLLEPRGKRASFLRHVVRTVPVENARVLAERVENLASPDYDASTSRAVGDLAEMIDGAPFLAPGGLLLAWTTEPQQLEEALALHFSLDRTQLLSGTNRRSIALFRKKG
jgi:16S rRNA (guanine527-N7)-methyltransferase